MPKNLPCKPNLENLRSQSKTLLKGYKANSPEALSRIQQVYNHLPEMQNYKQKDNKFTLVDAQFVIAREYGFKSWIKLKEHVESLSNCSIPIYKISVEKRKSLKSLFEGQNNRRTTVRAILDGRLGSAFSDSKTDPHVALINSGPVKIFGGDSKHPAALELVKKLSQGDVVCTDSERWKKLIMEIYSEKLICVNQFVPSSDTLTLTHLASITKNGPKNLSIVRMNTELCSNLGEELFDYEQFGSIENFIIRGVGFCGIIDNIVVCTAYSLRACDTSIDVMTGVIDDLKEQNIVEMVAASLLFYCLENNIEPIWQPVFNTEKAEESRKIAENLGYSHFEPHSMYVITGNPKTKKAYWSQDGWVEEGIDE